MVAGDSKWPPDWLRAATADPHEYRRRLLIDTGIGLGFYDDVADDWQERDFAAMDSGWRRALGHDEPDGFLRAYLERPRGHSKTTDIGVMASWALLASSRQLYGVVAAGDKDQARLVRDAIQKLVLDNPWLGLYLHVQNYRVVNQFTHSILDILASDVATDYGLTPDFLICDELTHWEKSEMWDAMFSAVAKRPLCLVIIISNAGIGEGSSWQWKVREMARTLDSWYFLRIDGPKASWISEEQLAEQRMALPPSAYRRLFDNLWVPGSGDALDPADIEAAMTLTGPPRFADQRREVIHLAGLDLGMKHDHTGFVTAAIEVGAGRVQMVECRSWKPQAHGGTVPLQAVEDAVFDSAKRFRTAITYYDPNECRFMAQRLANRGINMEEVVFQGKNLTGMASALLQAFTRRIVDLWPDEDLKRDLMRVTIVEKAYGYKLESVSDEYGHADRATALALLLPGALEAAGYQGGQMVESIGGRIGG